MKFSLKWCAILLKVAWNFFKNCAKFYLRFRENLLKISLKFQEIFLKIARNSPEN